MREEINVQQKTHFNLSLPWNCSTCQLWHGPPEPSLRWPASLCTSAGTSPQQWASYFPSFLAASHPYLSLCRTRWTRDCLPLTMAAPYWWPCRGTPPWSSQSLWGPPSCSLPPCPWHQGLPPYGKSLCAGSEDAPSSGCRPCHGTVGCNGDMMIPNFCFH